ncbi:transcriptional regulator [Candidatus Saccharibacteria bacterium]|nr:MAG: transcriptional regulator [Candidatus Saccharibacteria bacterium]
MECYELHNDIKAIRVRQSLSQSELADRVDVTRQTIAAIEKGDYSPSVLLALKLAAALATPINKLFWLQGDTHEN